MRLRNAKWTTDSPEPGTNDDNSIEATSPHAAAEPEANQTPAPAVDTRRTALDGDDPCPSAPSSGTKRPTAPRNNVENDDLRTGAPSSGAAKGPGGTRNKRAAAEPPNETAAPSQSHAEEGEENDARVGNVDDNAGNGNDDVYIEDGEVI